MSVVGPHGQLDEYACVLVRFIHKSQIFEVQICVLSDPGVSTNQKKAFGKRASLRYKHTFAQLFDVYCALNFCKFNIVD